jgi:hypothetical protein
MKETKTKVWYQGMAHGQLTKDLPAAEAPTQLPLMQKTRRQKKRE